MAPTAFVNQRDRE